MNPDEQDRRQKRNGRARRFARAADRGRYLPVTAAILAVAAVVALAAAPRAQSAAAAASAPAAAPVPTTMATAPPSGPGEDGTWKISPGSTDEVNVTEYDSTAQIEPGTTDTCLLTQKTLFAGPTDDVLPLMNNTAAVPENWEPMSGTEPVLSVSESDSSPSPGNMDGTMTLSDTVQVDAPQDCAIPAPDSNAALDDLVTPKGRATLQTAGRSAFRLPDWAKGLLAEVALFVIYTAIVFAFSAAFAALFTPAFAWVGEAIGGCVGGFVGNIAYNAIVGVSTAKNLAAAITSCVVSALEAVLLAKSLERMVTWIQKWRAERLVSSALQRAGASPATTESVEASLRFYIDDFDRELEMTPIPSPPPTLPTSP